MLLLIAGAPGAGKTTLARALAARLGWPLFEKDAFKETLFDALGFASRAEKVRLNDAAMALLCQVAGRTLACGQAVMLESNFETRDLPPLGTLLARSGARCVTVRVEADADVLYARFQARQHDPSRHLGHVVNGRYPPHGDERPPAAPLSREAFTGGIAARGMLDFALGTLLLVDNTDPSSVCPDTLAAQIHRLP